MAKTSNTKIEKISAVDQVADKIKEFILDDEWPVGSKLPPESELADMFGVNRLTVRMALQKLNTLGITETQVGNGTFVKHFSLTSHIANISEFYTTPDMLKDVYIFRKTIEIECLKLAIANGTPEEFEELKIRTDRYEKAQDKYFDILKDGSLPASKRDRQIYNQAILDMDIHEYIVSMAHNKLLRYSYSVAKSTLLQFMITLSKQRYEHNQDNRSHYHQDLYEAMASGNVEESVRIYLDMIDHNKLDV